MTTTMTPRQTLIEYLKMKVDQEDWHGASDAANDLREMDARGLGFAEGNKPLRLEEGLIVTETRDGYMHVKRDEKWALKNR